MMGNRMNKKIKIDHRVAVLNDINDAEIFIVVSDINIGIFGSHDALVAILASALAKSEDLRGIVADAAARYPKAVKLL